MSCLGFAWSRLGVLLNHLTTSLISPTWLASEILQSFCEPTCSSQRLELPSTMLANQNLRSTGPRQIAQLITELQFGLCVTVRGLLVSNCYNCVENLISIQFLLWLALLQSTEPERSLSACSNILAISIRFVGAYPWNSFFTLSEGLGMSPKSFFSKSGWSRI